MIAFVVALAAQAQTTNETTNSVRTLNVVTGNIVTTYGASSDEMTYTEDGTQLTIGGKTFAVSDIDRIYIDETAVDTTSVCIAYDGTSATVTIAGDVAPYVTATVNGAHVSIVQSAEVSDETCGEITYRLSGTSDDGEFQLEGSYKATVQLRGLTLTNPSGAAINIQDKKRINLSIKDGTVNTLTDGAEGSQKGCIDVKGHTELKGRGTLNVYGKAGHGIFSKEYLTMRNCTVNVLEAKKDGVNCNQYFTQESGSLTIKGVGDDGVQVSFKDDIDREGEDSAFFTLKGGTLDITVSADAAKGVKADSTICINDGKLTVTQTGNIVVEADDISYPTSVKAGGDIFIKGGTVNITNTAQGGKGLSAEGVLTIDESNATTTINITANGAGGTAETSGSGSQEENKSYKVYISLASQGGGGGMGPGGQSNSWTNPVLYASDGTKVASLTNTVSKSSGYSTLTFYYYDFKNADTSTTYYVQADSRTSGGGRPGGSSSTYTPRTAAFSAPTSGSDIYYSVSNSYTTTTSNGVTYRTYTLSNVTSTYGGTSDVSEDEGTAYNAIGMKADKDITISGGTITVANSGARSQSIKSKKNVTIDGGTITLKPSGAMQVINSDASYSSGIKCDDLTLNDGTVKITASGSAGRGISADNVVTNGGTLTIIGTGDGVQGSNDNYTAKGIKADQTIALNAGTISISMSGTGGKGIKSAGTYTQGKSDGSGPTLTVATTGSSLGSSSQGGGGNPWGGGGPGQESSGSSAKGIKVMGAVTLYGGQTEVSTETNGAEGLESKTSINIQGGKHYFKCYDDCINSSGKIEFNGGATVCYGFGNDAVDSNYGRAGAITIGNGAVFAFTTRGAPEEGLDCDNNSNIQITGNGIAISAGANQGGGGGWGGSSSSIGSATQGYYLSTSNLSYSPGRYYTLQDDSNNNFVTYSFPASCSSSLSLFTAKGMTSSNTYYVKYSTTEPTDATIAWHGLYIGSSVYGTTQLTSFKAQ